MDNADKTRKLVKNTEFTVDEILELIRADLLLALKRYLVYVPNTQATWDSARQAVDFELSRYSNFIDKYEITVDGTQYGDVIAQQSSSFEEYRLKYATAHGIEPPNMTETEFMVRHSVTKPNQVYFNVNIVFIGGETASIGATIT